jgi:hypothetical protein
MGDEKYYTIQIKGTAYRFRPIPPKDYERVALVQSLSTDSLKVVKAVTRVLANSAGPESWDTLTDMYLEGDLTLQELTVDLFQKLVTRQSKDGKSAKKTAGAVTDAPDLDGE